MNIIKNYPLKKLFKKGIISLVILFTLYLIIPLPSPLFSTDYNQIVTDEKGDYLRIFLNSNEQWIFPPSETEKIPDKLKIAVVNFEDKYFKWHWGINPVSLIRAIYQNIYEQRIVSGASTITMQVARLIKHQPRTYLNKILEIFLAIKIEFYYSKENILKAYLDHAPFGGNIRGYRAATEKYFEKSPKELSWAEAAALAVLPNAPGLVTPSSSNEILKQKRNKLLKKLFENNEINESTYKLALLEPIISSVYPFEITAPHLTRKIISENKNKKVIRTTIDKSIQQYLESVTKQYVENLKKEGIRNCSVIILETKTGKVKSYIGSQDYFGLQDQGMVDGVMAPRSSGSILKPFLYALSMDEGIIIPQTLIKDIPSYFDSFAPQNSDEKFSGVVTAKEALIRSLNIPAVRLLNTYGIFRFYSFLKNAGVSTLFRPAEDYGLPLIIGGAEVNLFDMAMLYSGLANNGSFRKPFYLVKDSLSQKSTSSQLISSGASYLTLEILKELKRPGAEYYWQRFQNQKQIAWKTGTSYGGKDAWAVGVSPKWTIGVWVGNFDGEPNPNLSGAQSAGPLLFEIFNYLPQEVDDYWFEKIDQEFRSVQVCKSTGFLAGEYCDEKENIDVPINMFPLRLCPFHKNIFVDQKSGYSVCSNCWGSEYKENHILVFPSDVNYYLNLRGQFLQEVPNHNPDCSKRFNINPIDILYPLDSTRVWLPRDYDGKLQKLIAKVAYNQKVKNIFWYMDDVYLGITKSKHERSIVLNKGWHDLYVNDEEGYSDKVRFYVNVKEQD